MTARKQGDHRLPACAMSAHAHTHCIYKCVAYCACVHVCVCVCVCVCVVYPQVLSEGQGVGAVSSLARGPHSADGHDWGHERDKVEVVIEGRITRRRYFSSRVFFFDVSTPSSISLLDLESPPPAPALPSPGLSDTEMDEFVGEKLVSAPRLPCVYRQGAMHERGALRVVDVVELANAFALGDWVRVGYVLNDASAAAKGERSVQARWLRVLRPWASSHPHLGPWDSDTCPPPMASLPNTRRAPKGEVCKFWLNSGRCHLRVCALRHVPEEERQKARAAWQFQRKLEKAEAQRRQEAAVHDTLEIGGSKKQHKKHRADLFCKWLVNEFGMACLRSGSGVLDVAGGRGVITAKLMEMGIACTVIDPRQQAHHNTERWLAQTHQQIAECFDEALWSNDKYHDVLAQCSVVIGMHPDQATEPLVDFAIAHRKPFAVVPCCVFPRLHLHRRTTVALNKAANIGNIGDTTGDIGDAVNAGNTGGGEGGGMAIEGGGEIGSKTPGHGTGEGVLWGLEEGEIQTGGPGGERRAGERGGEAAREVASVADEGVGVAGGEGVGGEADGGVVAGRGVVGELEEGDLVVTYEDFIGFLSNKHPGIKRSYLGVC